VIAIKAQKILILIISTAIICFAQSGRSSKGLSASNDVILNVFAYRTDGSDKPISLSEISLYESGFEQRIKNFVFDPSPSRIVILVDNSQTLRASVEKLQAAVKEFAYEIYEGDQIFIIAYDEKPEIIQEWTDDAKKIEASLSLFRKKDNPYLFDALAATLKEVILPLMPGTRKIAVVLISDGLDRGSKTPFEKILAELQTYDITVYALQIPDRTGGAYRRSQPKPSQIITDLTEGTGGLVFDLDEAQKAAKTICDELRKNRYLLSYSPTNPSSLEARRILLFGQNITFRTKKLHPPTLKPF
jgi:Ca-activated chloride channel family protein